MRELRTLNTRSVFKRPGFIFIFSCTYENFLPVICYLWEARSALGSLWICSALKWIWKWEIKKKFVLILLRRWDGNKNTQSNLSLSPQRASSFENVLKHCLYFSIFAALYIYIYICLWEAMRYATLALLSPEEIRPGGVKKERGKCSKVYCSSLHHQRRAMWWWGFR